MQTLFYNWVVNDAVETAQVDAVKATEVAMEEKKEEMKVTTSSSTEETK